MKVVQQFFLSLIFCSMVTTAHAGTFGQAFTDLATSCCPRNTLAEHERYLPELTRECYPSRQAITWLENNMRFSPHCSNEALYRAHEVIKGRSKTYDYLVAVSSACTVTLLVAAVVNNLSTHPAETGMLAAAGSLGLLSTIAVGGFVVASVKNYGGAGHCRYPAPPPEK